MTSTWSYPLPSGTWGRRSSARYQIPNFLRRVPGDPLVEVNLRLSASPHSKGHVARKRAVRRHYLDLARRCAGQHLRGDLGTRDDFERSRGAVKGHLGRVFQIVPEDLGRRPHFARGQQGLHESTQANAQAEGRAVVAGAARGGRAVNGATGRPNQAAIGVSAVSSVEAQQRPQGASWR